MHIRYTEQNFVAEREDESGVSIIVTFIADQKC